MGYSQEEMEQAIALLKRLAACKDQVSRNDAPEILDEFIYDAIAIVGESEEDEDGEADYIARTTGGMQP